MKLHRKIMNKHYSIGTGLRLPLTLIVCLISSTGSAAVDKTLPLPPKGETPSAEEIARQVYFANHFYAFKNFSIEKRGRTMTVLINRSSNGQDRATALERHLNNNYEITPDQPIQSRDLAIFHSGKLRGTGMLVTEYADEDKNKDYMIWLPALRKIRRFSQPQHDDAWGGSVFSFGDVTLRKPEDETHELIGKKTLHTCLGAIEELEGKHYRNAGELPSRSCRHINKEVYGLKSTTKFASWWYDYRVSYIDTTSFADYRTLYFKDGELIKVIDRDWGLVSEEKGGDPRMLFWKYWYGLDLRTGQQSWAVIPQKVVEYNKSRSNNFWTEKTLRKIKR